MPTPLFNKNIFIVGPTAGGKSALARRLAQETGARVYSMDAFKIYRDLDIGTAKPSEEERRIARHELLDLAGPLDNFSVGNYLAAAHDALARAGEANPAIWVGGTGLYFRALRKGLSPAPGTNPEMMRALSALPIEELIRRIEYLDPEWLAMANESDRLNPRRLARVVAVAQTTGKPLSAWWRKDQRRGIGEGTAFYLRPDKQRLEEKIEKRARRMLENGWHEEVQTLLKMPGWLESQSARAIGYREVAALVMGAIARDQCLERIVVKTLQYVRRQTIWFAREEGLIALDDHEEANAMRQLRSYLAGG